MPHPTDSLKDRTSAETVSRSDAWDALFAAEFPDFFLGEQAVAELGRNVFGRPDLRPANPAAAAQGGLPAAYVRNSA